MLSKAGEAFEHSLRLGRNWREQDSRKNILDTPRWHSKVELALGNCARWRLLQAYAVNGRRQHRRGLAALEV